MKIDIVKVYIIYLGGVQKAKKLSYGQILTTM